MMEGDNIKNRLSERNMIAVKSKYIEMLLFRRGMIELKRYWEYIWNYHNT